MAHKYWWITGIFIAMVVVVVLAPAASSDPDGMEKVAVDEGFIDEGEDPRYEWLPDYTVPGIENEYWSTVVSGIIGVGIMFAVLVLLGWGLSAIKRSRGGGASRPVPSSK